MDENIKEYIIDLLTIMGGKMDHMPSAICKDSEGNRVKMPDDVMLMKTSDRRDLIHRGWELMLGLEWWKNKRRDNGNL